MMPPRFPRWLLRRVLPEEHRAVVLTHLDEDFDRTLRNGSARAAARWYRRQAFASLPGALRMRARALGLFRLPGEFTQDTRYARRQMRRAPGFSAAAVLMLAIGLGLVAGAYTVVNGIRARLGESIRRSRYELSRVATKKDEENEFSKTKQRSTKQSENYWTPFLFVAFVASSMRSVSFVFLRTTITGRKTHASTKRTA
jgi:hypothetical protein